MSDIKAAVQETSEPTPLVRMMEQRPSSDIQGQSPLHHAELDTLAQQDQMTGGIQLCEKACLGHLNLRCDQNALEHREAIEKVLGMPLPLKPLSSNEVGNYSIRWISPDEWLIIVPGSETFEIESKLRNAFTGHYSLINSSGGSTVLEVSGKDVIQLMKKCTPIDVHLASFPVGKVVSTVFAKSTAVIRRTGETQFELIIRRSFADYIWLWLQDASSEFGLEIIK